MTIEELIVELMKYDPELPVVIHNWEYNGGDYASCQNEILSIKEAPKTTPTPNQKVLEISI